MIKSAKQAISAILGNADVNDEELMTAIIGAEGLINSRPLTYQSANPVDDVPWPQTTSCMNELGVNLRQRQWIQRSSTFETDGAVSKS